jgi:hypothetical protein
MLSMPSIVGHFETRADFIVVGAEQRLACNGAAIVDDIIRLKQTEVSRERRLTQHP